MSDELIRREHLVIAVSDHEMLTAYLEHFRKLFADWPPKDVTETVFALKQLLNQRLVNHFAHEEAHVFPALLGAGLGEATAASVARLLADHQAMMVDVRRLNGMLSNQELFRDHPTELRLTMLDFFERLQEHASREDEMFRALPDTGHGTL